MKSIVSTLISTKDFLPRNASGDYLDPSGTLIWYGGKLLDSEYPMIDEGSNAVDDMYGSGWRLPTRVELTALSKSLDSSLLEPYTYRHVWSSTPSPRIPDRFFLSNLLNGKGKFEDGDVFGTIWPVKDI